MKTTEQLERIENKLDEVKQCVTGNKVLLKSTLNKFVKLLDKLIVNGKCELRDEEAD